MRIVIVNYVNQFGSTGMKAARPSICLSSSKKHMKVVPITQHPNNICKQVGFYFEDGHYKGWVNPTKTFTVNRENVVGVKKKLSSDNEKKIKHLFSTITSQNYLCNFK